MLKTIALGLAGVLAFCSLAAAQTPGPDQVMPVLTTDAQHPSDTWLLHLPGISGRRWIDDEWVLGLRDAGFTGTLDIYDWTAADPGIGSLLAYKRNQSEAQKVADMIVDRVHKQPGVHIILCGHSGGTGVAVWALEKLPAGVKIDKLIMLASALSPGYDLSPALSHVRVRCYSFCSENDVLVLGAGCRMLGTIDGKKTEAAGQFGFCLPPGADVAQYEKLIQKPYDKSWMAYRNFGDHIGCMLRGFSREIIGPLIIPAADLVKTDHPAAGDKVAKRIDDKHNG